MAALGCLSTTLAPGGGSAWADIKRLQLRHHPYCVCRGTGGGEDAVAMLARLLQLLPREEEGGT